MHEAPAEPVEYDPGGQALGVDAASSQYIPGGQVLQDVLK